MAKNVVIGNRGAANKGTKLMNNIKRGRYPNSAVILVAHNSYSTKDSDALNNKSIPNIGLREIVIDNQLRDNTLYLLLIVSLLAIVRLEAQFTCTSI